MSRSRPARPPKIQRWMDLIAALLGRRFSVTFEQLARDVPAYASAPSREAVLRMFERDKDELRALGVPILTVIDRDGQCAGYVLRRQDFHLPYLVPASTTGASKPAQRVGYRDLPCIELDPDEVLALAEAAERARLVDDPEVAADAKSATAKLMFDLRKHVRETLAVYQGGGG